MKTKLRTAHGAPDTEPIVALLAAGGLTATILDRCPLPTCEVCLSPKLDRAA